MKNEISNGQRKTIQATVSALGLSQDFAKAITIKYYSQYQKLLNKLIANGKVYAASHGIKLTEVNPTPY